jgi:hypothetical protein
MFPKILPGTKISACLNTSAYDTLQGHKTHKQSNKNTEQLSNE